MTFHHRNPVWGQNRLYSRDEVVHVGYMGEHIVRQKHVRPPSQ